MANRIVWKPEVYYNYVGGEWTESSSKERLESYNPATGELVAYAQNSTVRDVEQAIDSVVETFRKSDWGSNPKRRYEALLGLAHKIEQNLERLATILTLEQGKTIRESRLELEGCV
ncbi:MAG: aldehyde dehydrogenase family protein, partial [Alicyclobacillaceae bacterium]|nr:aldehyde dehydrogenase family protein [Alicyclobacillaceae bacterium]